MMMGVGHGQEGRMDGVNTDRGRMRSCLFKRECDELINPQD